MDDWISQDRSAFQASLARANLDGLRLWVLLGVGQAAAAVAAAAWLAPEQPGVPYGMPLLHLVLAGALGIAAWRRPDAILPVQGAATAVLVLFSGVAVGSLLIAAPVLLAPVAAGLLLSMVGAALVYTWELPLGVGVQAGLLACWGAALLLGPGMLGDPAQVGASSLLLLGGAVLAAAGQRRRYIVAAQRLQRERELARATEVVDSERDRVRRSGQAKDQLFSDVTNGLREPVVRMLRDLDQRRLRDPAAAAELAHLWRDGLRLLRKLDDLGSLALHQRGYLRLRAQRVDLRAEVERILAPVVERAGAMGVEVVLTCEALPEDVHLDRSQFERVLLAMLAEALRTCALDAEIQVELRVEHLVTGTEQARLEVWCEAPEEPIDRGAEDDFWREPEGTRVELRLARALAELHGGRLVEPTGEGGVLSWVFLLRTGTSHLTDEVIDRRVRDRGGVRGRRFEDREGMVWAWQLTETAEYRLLEIDALVERGLAEGEPPDAAGSVD